MDRYHCAPGSPVIEPDAGLHSYRSRLLQHTPMKLTMYARTVVDEVIQEVCQHKGWELHARNVRTNHVHVVVSAHCMPERVMNAFKAWATRRLRSEGVVGAHVKPWSRHGSTKYLWTEEEIARACDYTVEGQGEDLVVQRPNPSTSSS